MLTLTAPCIFKSCIKIKTNLNFYFYTCVFSHFFTHKSFWGTTKKWENKKFFQEGLRNASESILQRFSSVEQVNNAIQRFERDASTKFAVYMMDKEFWKSSKLLLHVGLLLLSNLNTQQGFWEITCKHNYSLGMLMQDHQPCSLWKNRAWAEKSTLSHLVNFHNFNFNSF